MATGRFVHVWKESHGDAFVFVVIQSFQLCPSCSLRPHACVACQAPLSMGFPRQEYWNGCQFFLQGIFLSQGSNPSPLHWQADSLPLSHLESPNLFLGFNFFSSTGFGLAGVKYRSSTNLKNLNFRIL